MILGQIWKYLFGGSLFLCILLGIALQMERRHSQKLQERNATLVAKLNEISSKRNEQRVVTRDRIITVEKQIRHADDQAKVIEQAKLPGQCKTPPQIMGADL